jgi:hypothetical protein
LSGAKSCRQKEYDMANKTSIKLTAKQFNQAIAALARYERRQARIEHPQGDFDNAKRFYPTGPDADALGSVRSPSRGWPNSYNLACRSLPHCERLEGADHAVVLMMKRELKKANLYATSPGAAEVLRKAFHLRAPRALKAAVV